MTSTRILFLFFSGLFSLTFFPIPAFAQTKLGIHVLDPEEIDAAANLLPNGGYVTIPIKTDQLDRERWQHFLDVAHDKNIEPIFRLATTFGGTNWERPTRKDIIQFSNFLSSLTWHSDSMTVVAFNEPNHAEEWGGAVDAEDYGQRLTFLVDWFKTEKKHYVVLPAGLDMSARTVSTSSMSGYAFLDHLVAQFPQTLKLVDGWASHAYPNPAFSGKPTDIHEKSIRSYQYETRILKEKLDLEIPVYVTETGWAHTQKTMRTVSTYLSDAYEEVWAKDPSVRAVTVFLLSAQAGPFEKFSLLDGEGNHTLVADTIQKLSSL